MKHLGKARKKFLLLAISVVLSSSFYSNVYADYVEISINEFSDVNQTDWFYTYINNAIKAGAINGYPDGTYQPSKAVTKGEFIKIMVSALDMKNISTAETPYNILTNTLKNHWAYDYFVIAESYNIVPMTFYDQYLVAKLDEPCTREEMAYVLSNITSDILKEEQVSISGVQNLIRDYARVDSDYQSYVVDAYARGLIGGNDVGNFEPKNSMTRAEIATVLTRVLKKDQRIIVDTGISEVDLSKVTYDLTDPERGPAKIGDVVLGADGKIYTVELDQKIKDELGVEVVGVGIPVALDLGREDLLKKDDTAATYVTDGKSCANPKSKYFGQRYTVFNGEGHYSKEWIMILGEYRPTVNGTYNGEIDSTGYFEWSTTNNYWGSRFDY